MKLMEVKGLVRESVAGHFAERKFAERTVC